MFNLIAVGFLMCIAGIVALFGLTLSIEECLIISYVIGGISFVWFIASTLSTFTQYNLQLERFEKLHADLNNLVQFKKMKEELSLELKSYLGVVYPDHEKEIFNSISNANSDINVVLNYPEIKASSVLKELANRIRELYNNLYSLQRNIEHSCSDIRYHNTSKWEFIKPTIPTVLEKIIFSIPDSNN